MRSFLFFGVLALLIVSAPYARAQFLSVDERARLEAEYTKLQTEIVEWQKVLDDTRIKKNTLQGDVTVLNAQIKKAETEIKQKNITISNLAAEIRVRSSRIRTLTERIERGRESLAAILREQNETDDYSIAEIALASESVSAFFSNTDALSVISRDLQSLFEGIRTAKTQTEEERAALSKRQDDEVDARYTIETKKQGIAKNEAEKKQLLTITKSQEQEYQKVLADRQQQAERIRNALFPLRDAAGISFSDALDYASLASKATGVRSALILAVLSQESDLGKNVGSCYVSDLTTGDGVGKNTGSRFEKVMKAPRDTEPFERITSALSLQWATSAVSCPLGATYSTSRGYGGAMGPSQFIPSTWELYESRLSRVLLVGTANPWNAKHAIMATALFLEDLGASVGTYTAERNAACRYYSGRSCDTKKPTNYVYGNQVMTKAEKFQNDIDFLKGI